MRKNLPANAEDTRNVGLIPGSGRYPGVGNGNPLQYSFHTRNVDLIPGSGRYPGIGNGNPLQYSFLENLMDRGAWWATVHGVGKSWV